ncbi:hypothetical protein Bbelb_300580 [Branchiostoma belcheri]|nr:hypothetical protein Bbelb_300580 [Branchiostoma belcheri]
MALVLAIGPAAHSGGASVVILAAYSMHALSDKQQTGGSGDVPLAVTSDLDPRHWSHQGELCLIFFIGASSSQEIPFIHQVRVLGENVACHNGACPFPEMSTKSRRRETPFEEGFSGCYRFTVRSLLFQRRNSWLSTVGAEPVSRGSVIAPLTMHSAIPVSLSPTAAFQCNGGKPVSKLCTAFAKATRRFNHTRPARSPAISDTAAIKAEFSWRGEGRNDRGLSLWRDLLVNRKTLPLMDLTATIKTVFTPNCKLD